MRKLLLSIMCITIAVVANAQNFNRSISLNLQVESDTTLLNVFTGDTVTSIGVSGHITYTSELGFVRFVVNDNYDDEYMIYESYRLFENDSSFNFSQKCEESCFFESYVPTELIIQVHDAIVTITSVNLSNTSYPNAEYMRKNAAVSANNNKLTIVQNHISDNGLIWEADHTSISDMSYASKARLWGKDYMSYGYEYYSRGFFSLFGPERYAGVRNYGFVDNFDWRNRHGANSELSPYYDGDIQGTGWISPVVCQKGCWFNGTLECNYDETMCESLGGDFREAPSCWAFGPTAQVEALTNLYYNDHIDVDLSEQFIICRVQSDTIHNGIEADDPEKSLISFKTEGVPVENCLHYSATLDNCDDLCDNPTERIQIEDYTKYDRNNYTIEQMRQYLMQYGPLTASGVPIHTWNHHCMLLVGWGVIDEDAPEILGLENNAIDDSWYGTPYWIYKTRLEQKREIMVSHTFFIFITMYRKEYLP